MPSQAQTTLETAAYDLRSPLSSVVSLTERLLEDAQRTTSQRDLRSR